MNTDGKNFKFDHALTSERKTPRKLILKNKSIDRRVEISNLKDPIGSNVSLDEPSGPPSGSIYL